MEFNNIWTKEKNDKLREFIKEGKDVDFIRNYFGEDLLHHPKKKYSGSALLPFHLFQENVKKMYEISLNPEKTYYSSTPEISKRYKNKADYISTFMDNDTEYTIAFEYIIINKKEAYNIVFTTYDQWNKYKTFLLKFNKKGYITNEEFKILSDIISKDTNFNNLFSVFRKLSYVVLDFYEKNLKDNYLAFIDTENPTKIKLYQNIIKDSFPYFHETVENVDGYKYHLYNNH